MLLTLCRLATAKRRMRIYIRDESLSRISELKKAEESNAAYDLMFKTGM